MPLLCPRCEATLPVVDGAPAAFCAACGLPQLRVDDDALERLATDSATGAAVPPGSRGPASGMDWGLAFRIATAGAAIGLLPCALLPGAVVSGGAGLVALLLLPLLVLGCSSVYLRRRPYRPFSASMGARLGATLALLLSAMLTLGSGISGFVLRYWLHRRTVEQNLDLAMQQFQVRMDASATPLPAAWETVLQWPEVRAGSFLLGQVFTNMLLLLTGLLAGAVAGALLGARQRRGQQT